MGQWQVGKTLLLPRWQGYWGVRLEAEAVYWTCDFGYRVLQALPPSLGKEWAALCLLNISSVRMCQQVMRHRKKNRREEKCVCWWEGSGTITMQCWPWNEEVWAYISILPLTSPVPREIYLPLHRENGEGRFIQVTFAEHPPESMNPGRFWGRKSEQREVAYVLDWASSQWGEERLQSNNDTEAVKLQKRFVENVVEEKTESGNRWSRMAAVAVGWPGAMAWRLDRVKRYLSYLRDPTDSTWWVGLET